MSRAVAGKVISLFRNFTCVYLCQSVKCHGKCHRRGRRDASLKEFISLTEEVQNVQLLVLAPEDYKEQSSSKLSSRENIGRNTVCLPVF